MLRGLHPSENLNAARLEKEIRKLRVGIQRSAVAAACALLSSLKVLSLNNL